MNFFFTKKLISHYLSATFIDVLHSPFVFDLYQSAIKRQPNNAQFKKIEDCRKQLLQNSQIINYSDLGAGSNILNTKSNKKIKSLAMAHLKPARLAQIIYHLVNKFKHKNIIELGTSLGITTSYIATAIKENHPSSNTNFHTIEGVSDVRNTAIKQFETLELTTYINSIEGNFNDKLDEVLEKYEALDVFFVDGNHSYEATINYFVKALSLAHNDSMFIFDDIYWSKGMAKAWEEIKANPNVLQTVDLFFIGLVFFRKEQKKQHFKLRVF